MEIMNYFVNWNVFLIFVVLVVICDILLCFYKCNFNLLNYFLVAVMCISYPINLITGFVVFVFLGLVVAAFDGIFSINIKDVENLMFLILFIISMILGGLINYKIYHKIKKNITIYEFSKFNFFSIMFVPFYVYFLYCWYHINKYEMTVFIMWFAIPIGTIFFTFIYSLIKILIITDKKGAKNV